MPTWFLYPKAGTAMSMRGEPSSDGLALENLTVQRASRSFCASLAGLSFHASGMRPALISVFSPSVLRCFGCGDDRRVDDLSAHRQEAGLPQRRVVGAKQHLDRRLSPDLARVSASRKVQIVFASGTGSDSPSPRKRMNESRSLIRNSVRSSDSEWLACRIRTLNMNT